MRHPGEPSVEEILESIKRVIAREDRGERFARTPAMPASAGRPAEPEAFALAADVPEATALDDVLDLAKHATIHGRPADPDAAAAAPAAPLVTDDASSSMRGSLAALAAAASAPDPTAAVRPGTDAGALEPLVRELLRPALADWLDRNLPAIVERMVAAEIARIAGRTG